jgi:hypothetical protein
MTPPIRENVPRQEIESRRRRAILSFRRKRDVAWFLLTVVPFIVACTLLAFKVRLRKPVPAPPAAEAR